MRACADDAGAITNKDESNTIKENNGQEMYLVLLQPFFKFFVFLTEWYTYSCYSCLYFYIKFRISKERLYIYEEEVIASLLRMFHISDTFESQLY
jgi:hypothetical protein